MVLMTSSIEMNNYTILPDEYEKQYFYEFILALYKRICLKKISLECKSGINIKKARKKFISFTKNFKDTDTVLGVKSQITEVVYNLIDNAFEAIEEKQKTLSKDEAIKYIPKIDVSLTYKDNKTIIKISDNGIGIKEEHTGKIYIPFFTTKASCKSGTGIGMYIVKRMIAENHKGKIWFESKYMVGTDITIELPNL